MKWSTARSVTSRDVIRAMLQGKCGVFYLKPTGLDLEIEIEDENNFYFSPKFRQPSYFRAGNYSWHYRYRPSQEEECQDQFRKVCTIEFQTEASEETLEVCGPELLSSCEKEEGEVECRTEYKTECSTRQTAHQVMEDVVQCQTVSQEKCQDLSEGSQTRRECQSWPVQRCVVSQRNITKHSPTKACSPRPTQLCSPRGCSLKEGPVVCQERRQTVLRQSPVERCELQPEEKCGAVTRLLPALHTTETCLQVPRETCSLARINPRKIRKPTIKKWCFNQEKLKGLFE